MRNNKHINRCRNCGKELTHSAKTRGKPFCSNHCRNTWWNNQRGDIALYPNRDYDSYRAVCFHCGREFETYGRGQRYCSVECQREDSGKRGLP
jgi:endogenous inhibitor of DNA gyrase (YacG/DUF329 family)